MRMAVHCGSQNDQYPQQYPPPLLPKPGKDNARLQKLIQKNARKKVGSCSQTPIPFRASLSPVSEASTDQEHSDLPTPPTMPGTPGRTLDSSISQAPTLYGRTFNSHNYSVASLCHHFRCPFFCSLCSPLYRSIPALSSQTSSAAVQPSNCHTAPLYTCSSFLFDDATDLPKSGPSFEEDLGQVCTAVALVTSPAAYNEANEQSSFGSTNQISDGTQIAMLAQVQPTIQPLAQFETHSLLQASQFSGTRSRNTSFPTNTHRFSTGNHIKEQTSKKNHTLHDITGKSSKIIKPFDFQQKKMYTSKTTFSELSKPPLQNKNRLNSAYHMAPLSAQQIKIASSEIHRGGLPTQNVPGSKILSDQMKTPVYQANRTKNTNLNTHSFTSHPAFSSSKNVCQSVPKTQEAKHQNNVFLHLNAEVKTAIFKATSQELVEGTTFLSNGEHSLSKTLLTESCKPCYLLDSIPTKKYQTYGMEVDHTPATQGKSPVAAAEDISRAKSQGVLPASCTYQTQTTFHHWSPRPPARFFGEERPNDVLYQSNLNKLKSTSYGHTSVKYNDYPRIKANTFNCPPVSGPQTYNDPKTKQSDFLLSKPLTEMPHEIFFQQTVSEAKILAERSEALETVLKATTSDSVMVALKSKENISKSLAINHEPSIQVGSTSVASVVETLRLPNTGNLSAGTSLPMIYKEKMPVYPFHMAQSNVGHNSDSARPVPVYSHSKNIIVHPETELTETKTNHDPAQFLKIRHDLKMSRDQCITTKTEMCSNSNIANLKDFSESHSHNSVNFCKLNSNKHLTCFKSDVVNHVMLPSIHKYSTTDSLPDPNVSAEPNQPNQILCTPVHDKEVHQALNTEISPTAKFSAEENGKIAILLDVQPLNKHTIKASTSWKDTPDNTTPKTTTQKLYPLNIAKDAVYCNNFTTPNPSISITNNDVSFKCEPETKAVNKPSADTISDMRKTSSPPVNLAKDDIEDVKAIETKSCVKLSECVTQSESSENAPQTNPQIQGEDLSKLRSTECNLEKVPVKVSTSLQSNSSTVPKARTDQFRCMINARMSASKRLSTTRIQLETFHIPEFNVNNATVADTQNMAQATHEGPVSTDNKGTTKAQKELKETSPKEKPKGLKAKVIALSHLKKPMIVDPENENDKTVSLAASQMDSHGQDVMKKKEKQRSLKLWDTVLFQMFSTKENIMKQNSAKKSDAEQQKMLKNNSLDVTSFVHHLPILLYSPRFDARKLKKAAARPLTKIATVFDRSLLHHKNESEDPKDFNQTAKGFTVCPSQKILYK